MTWVRRHTQPAHMCAAPREAGYRTAPLGHAGDLWRCNACGTLWRIGNACDVCDRFGERPHPGGHEIGTKWRAATLWQRIRYRRRR